MGKVKIKISYHPRVFTGPLQIIWYQKWIITLKKQNLEPLKISSGSGIVEYVPSSKGENPNILAPEP